MKSETSKNFSLFIIIIAFFLFIYTTIQAIIIVDKTQIGTSEGIYTSYVTTSAQIEKKAKSLTKKCSTKLCKVQTVLNFVTDIPYSSETFQRYTAKKTISQNFGDCDDKSNLLISLLHALNIKAYFVLVPKHIFVIVPIEDKRVKNIKGLWINGEKYYILESTAKGSSVGYPLKYNLDEIEVIIEPFENEKMVVEELIYR
ncbi:MAG: transglutaminase domain-containing protein [Campylobacterota bacterium]|nr:transglutaminase domain-containing protein [Campylobacterota bacterium]